MLHADLDTLQRVREVLTEAMAKGADPAELLDRVGLLSYPAKTRLCERETLLSAADVLGQVTVGQMARVESVRIPATPLDTQRLCVAWLQRQAKAIL